MLSPSIQLQIGSLTYGPQIAALRVRRVRLPAVDRLDVVLPTGVRLDATPGDDVTLELDGGEGSDTVFTGRVAEIRRRFDTVTVTARGGADRLARARPSLALDQITAGSAITRIATAAEVETGEIADGPSLAIYAADGRATALAEVARLAALSGASAHFDGAGRLSVPDPEQPAEPLALRYGREILAAESADGDVSGPAPHVVGEGGDPSGPQARWVLADFDRGGAGSADARHIAMPEIRTKQDADKAAAALAAARAARAKSVRLTTFLLPALAPGLPLQLAEMPGGVPLSRATVHQVVHMVRPDGAAVSEVWGTGFSSEDSLLGSLLGAVGGLLSSRVAEMMAAFARDQAERRTFCELAVVTSVFDDASGDDSHTVSVKLKDTGLALRNLPVAAWATGLACLPRVGDVVLVLFPRGSLVSGIVVGQVYSDDRRPPTFAKDEIALVWPEGQEDRAVIRIDGTVDPKISLAAGGDGEVAIELKKGEVKLTASGVALRLTYSGSSDGAVTLDAGGTKVELKQDGDLTVTAAGKLTLHGAEVSIEADGPVKINGATVDLN